MQKFEKKFTSGTPWYELHVNISLTSLLSAFNIVFVILCTYNIVITSKTGDRLEVGYVGHCFSLLRRVNVIAGLEFYQS